MRSTSRGPTGDGRPSSARSGELTDGQPPTWQDATRPPSRGLPPDAGGLALAIEGATAARAAARLMPQAATPSPPGEVALQAQLASLASGQAALTADLASLLVFVKAQTGRIAALEASTPVQVRAVSEAERASWGPRLLSLVRPIVGTAHTAEVVETLLSQGNDDILEQLQDPVLLEAAARRAVGRSSRPTASPSVPPSPLGWETPASGGASGGAPAETQRDEAQRVEAQRVEAQRAAQGSSSPSPSATARSALGGTNSPAPNSAFTSSALTGVQALFSSLKTITDAAAAPDPAALAAYRAIEGFNARSADALLASGTDGTIASSALARFAGAALAYRARHGDAAKLLLASKIDEATFVSLRAQTVFADSVGDAPPDGSSLPSDSSLLAGMLALLKERAGPVSVALKSLLLGKKPVGHAGQSRQDSIFFIDSLLQGVSFLVPIYGSSVWMAATRAFLVDEVKSVMSKEMENALLLRLSEYSASVLADATPVPYVYMRDVKVSFEVVARVWLTFLNSDRKIAAELTRLAGPWAGPTPSRKGVDFSGRPDRDSAAAGGGAGHRLLDGRAPYVARGRSVERGLGYGGRARSASNASRAPTARPAEPYKSDSCRPCYDARGQINFRHGPSECWTRHPELRPSKADSAAAAAPRGAGPRDDRGGGRNGDAPSRGDGRSGGAPQRGQVRRIAVAAGSGEDVSWHPSADRFCPSTPTVLTSVGLAFFDTGADFHIVEASALAGAPGLSFQHVNLVAGGALGNVQITQLATFSLAVFTSHDDGDGALAPLTNELGGVISAYVVPAGTLAVLDVGAISLVLTDRDASTNAFVARVYDFYHDAMKAGGTGFFSHLQQRSRARREPLGALHGLHDVSVVADVHEDAVLDEGDAGGSANPFTPTPNFSSAPPESMLSRLAGTPSLSFEQVVAIIRPRLGEIAGRYPDLFIQAFYQNQGVLAPPRSGPTQFFRPKVVDGTPPSKLGLQRRVAPALEQTLYDEVTRFVDLNHAEWVVNEAEIEGLSLNPWVVVSRGDGRNRVCVDCSSINSKIDGETDTVLPDMAAHIAAVADSHVATALDLSNAFQQTGIDPSSRHLFGFVVKEPSTGTWRYGRFKVSVFGWAQMPGWFQDFMQVSLKDVVTADPQTAIPIFLDNVDIATRALGRDAADPLPPGSVEERELVERHVAALTRVLAAYQAAGLWVNISKCTFGASQVKTMGVVVGSGSYEMDGDRLASLDVLANVPEIKSLRWLQATLGTANSLREFAGTEFVSLADPLFALLKEALSEQRATPGPKGAAVRAANAYLSRNWTAFHSDALASLVARLRERTKLIIMRRDRPVYVQMDASDAGVGGSAGQYLNDGRFYFAIVFGRRFTPLQRLWSVGGRELYGWLLFMRRWWRSLLGHEVVYRGDHLNLLQVEDLENTHVQRWLAELSCFYPWASQFRAAGWTARFHVPGVCIALCDFLSRYAQATSWVAQSDGALPPPASTDALRVRRLSINAPESSDSAARASNSHTSSLSPWLQAVASATASLTAEERDGLVAAHGAVVRTTAAGVLLFVGQRVLLPPSATALTDSVLKMTHDRYGHPDFETSYKLIVEAKIFIPELRARLRKWYDSCSCQLARAPHAPLAQGAYLTAPQAPIFGHLYADFASLVDGKSADGLTSFIGLLIIVCARSRFTQMYPVSAFNADAVVDSYRRWRAIFGPPGKFSSDRGSHFDNKALRKALEVDGVQLDVGTPHHHRGRALVERRVGIAKQLLRKLLPPGKVATWPSIIDDLNCTLNQLPSRSLAGISSYEYAFGVRPTRPVRLELFSEPHGLTAPQAVEDRLLLLTALRFVADGCSDALGFLRAAESAATLADVSFGVGANVALFYPERENALGSYYRGPFRVTDRDGDFYVVREILALDALGKGVRTHVSRLMPYDISRTSPNELHLAKLPDGFFVVRSVVDGPRADGKFQVSWTHTDELTWEPPVGLLSAKAYVDYCAANGLERSGVPKVVSADLPPAPSLSLPQAAAATALSSEQEAMLPLHTRPRRAGAATTGRWAAASRK